MLLVMSVVLFSELYKTHNKNSRNASKKVLLLLRGWQLLAVRVPQSKGDSAQILPFSVEKKISTKVTTVLRYGCFLTNYARMTANSMASTRTIEVFGC